MNEPLELALPFPPSTNSYWRNVAGKTLISADGRAYRRHVLAVASMHRLGGRFAAEARLRVILQLLPPDKRRRDVDNYTKALFDAFTHAGIWADDEQVVVLHVIKRGPCKPGHVLVSVDVDPGFSTCDPAALIVD